jgi:hypothetical protein
MLLLYVFLASLFGPNDRIEPTETDSKRQTDGNNPVVRNVNVPKLPFRKESFGQMFNFKLNYSQHAKAYCQRDDV